MSIRVNHFASFDGQEMAWREVGEGRPVVLLHGYISNAETNWIKFGHADAIAAKGFRVIMPDLRAHGDSAKPHDPSAYPPDALTRDGSALVAHLGLTDYDLAGYSLGGRTVVRMLATGARPRRAIVAGMGLEGILDAERRGEHFRRILSNPGKHERGSPGFLVEAFLKTTGGDAIALRLLIDSFTSTSRDALEAMNLPILVLAGDEDGDNGSHAALAAALPRATLREVPGGHMSAVTKPDFGLAMAAFLAMSE